MVAFQARSFEPCLTPPTEAAATSTAPQLRRRKRRERLRKRSTSWGGYWWPIGTAISRPKRDWWSNTAHSLGWHSRSSVTGAKACACRSMVPQTTGQESPPSKRW